MFDQIEVLKSKMWLFLSAFLMSGCVNSDPNNIQLDKGYCNLIEKTINLDRLQQYYHVDTFPGRSPLVVAVGNVKISCKDLVKFGKPVIFVDENNASRKSNEVYFEITKIDVSNSSAYVNFKYTPEGIRGEIKFKKLNSEWAILDSSIVEM